MRQFLIYLLGGVTTEDFLAADERSSARIDNLCKGHIDNVNLLISEHDAALRQAAVQLRQTQEMLRQKELECEAIERGRVAMNDAYHDASERLRLTSEQCTKLRDDNAAILAQAEAVGAERDTLKAKLSRPKKPKPAQVEA